MQALKQANSLLIISAVILSISTDYCGVLANEAAATSSATAAGEGGASAAASAASGAEPSWVDETIINAAALEPGPDFPGMDKIALLKQGVANEVNVRPLLYDASDVDEFMQDDIAAIQYLNQRSDDWRRAYRLAIKTLRWRAQMGLNHVDASHFPCDLFKLGLIFEHGRTHQPVETGEYVEGNPVIWIRLGALGSVIKHLERLTPKRLLSYGLHTAKSAGSGTKKLIQHILHPHAPPRVTAPKPYRHENLSMKEEQTIQHIFRAIAWWINNWRLTHPVGAQATLVLDFENTDFATASTYATGFFVGLDDHFPDLFDQIIGFRLKSRLLSVHSKLGLLNRIFKSRLSSSPETDSKFKMVKQEPKISSFMPRVDVHGFSMLPEHVSEQCMSPAEHEAPIGCQDAGALAASGLYDPMLWQAIHNEFYQLCKPKSRRALAQV